MDFMGALLSELMAFIGYAVLFTIAYKLFQMNTVLGEIKELLQSQRRQSAFPATDPSPAAVTTGDAATDYAQNLLRAVNAAQSRSGSEPRETVNG